jgi:hypothetical protein
MEIMPAQKTERNNVDDYQVRILIKNKGARINIQPRF